MNFLKIVLVLVGLMIGSVAAAGGFQCYSCFPDGPNMQKCNEPQESQLVSCPARPDGSQACWMTIKEDVDKSFIVSRGCGRAMEAPGLRNDECKKSKDKTTGSTDQICNCATSRCNKNNCRNKSRCFL
ncbi:hypothetical protein BV898_14930 [Hypsibius exemplaris]|uniref:UPAR/Ly6 domain-containing protein n=1 Tax=Hypsibius exemplaris TaxID=2072580 RepID=A0A9X6NBY8_HYPEX|nr:hypothetical protein BV898_14930 [Hypsibius exemplaris]